MAAFPCSSPFLNSTYFLVTWGFPFWSSRKKFEALVTPLYHVLPTVVPTSGQLTRRLEWEAKPGGLTAPSGTGSLICKEGSSLSLGTCGPLLTLTSDTTMQLLVGWGVKEQRIEKRKKRKIRCFTHSLWYQDFPFSFFIRTDRTKGPLGLSFIPLVPTYRIQAVLSSGHGNVRGENTVNSPLVWSYFTF